MTKAYKPQPWCEETHAVNQMKQTLLNRIMAKVPVNPTHRRIGEKFGIPMGVAGRLKRGELEQFTLDYLVKLNIRLGYVVGIVSE